MPTLPRPHPIRFTPILKEKVWGGRRLADLGKALPPGALIGESWEIADLDSTSPTGAGGDAAHSLAATGPLAGRSIREIMALWRSDLLGGASPAPAGAFPLLIKFLDAAANLSVQVHPSAAYAATHPDAHLKHEAWCVVAAEPGSKIYRGLDPGVTRADLEKAVRIGAVADLLRAEPATPGMIHHLPSGVVHALGAGILVAEVQTPSDTTFRLDDWGRPGRSLHIVEALACAFDDAGAQTVPADLLPPPAPDRITTEAFKIEQFTLEPGARRALGDPVSPTILMTLAGAGTLEPADIGFEPIEVAAGDTTLIPAANLGVRFVAREASRALAVTIP